MGSAAQSLNCLPGSRPLVVYLFDPVRSVVSFLDVTSASKGG
jgi:hypothetical protein